MASNAAAKLANRYSLSSDFARFELGKSSATGTPPLALPRKWGKCQCVPWLETIGQHFSIGGNFTAVPEKFAPEVDCYWTIFHFKIVSEPTDFLGCFQLAINKQSKCPAVLEANPGPLHFNVGVMVTRSPIPCEIRIKII